MGHVLQYLIIVHQHMEAKGLSTLVAERATLCPETGDFVAENDKKKSPEKATKLSVSGYKVSVFGNTRGQAITL